MVDEIVKEALLHAQPENIVLFNKYFKCIPGGYGEGDTFAGIKNPPIKTIAKKNINIDLSNLEVLLKHRIHEIRLLALYIFQFKFNSKKTSESEKSNLVQIYLRNTQHINNWDLVDVSAHHVIGAFYYKNTDDIIISLSYSDYLWENRIAMIATFFHIRKNKFDLALHIAENLLNHEHDIIHKAVGWMLREIGKREINVELNFLKLHYKNMPRTMLRYAIEKFEEPLRQQILKGTY